MMASGSSRNYMFGIYQILYNLPCKCNKKLRSYDFAGCFAQYTSSYRRQCSEESVDCAPDKRFTMRHPITKSRTSKISEFCGKLHTITCDIQIPRPDHQISVFFAKLTFFNSQVGSFTEYRRRRPVI